MPELFDVIIPIGQFAGFVVVVWVVILLLISATDGGRRRNRSPQDKDN